MIDRNPPPVKDACRGVVGEDWPASCALPNCSNLVRRDDMGLIEVVSGPSPCSAMLTVCCQARVVSRSVRKWQCAHSYPSSWVVCAMHFSALSRASSNPSQAAPPGVACRHGSCAAATNAIPGAADETYRMDRWSKDRRSG